MLHRKWCNVLIQLKCNQSKRITYFASSPKDILVYLIAHPLPPRQGGSGLIGPAGPADQAPLHSGLLPTSEPGRASLMHKTVTHNRCHATYNDFCEAVLGFLRRDVPSRWNTFCDNVTDNFRIISPEDFRVLR
jgi:hypothetical protein